jgi:adenylate cyclase
MRRLPITVLLAAAVTLPAVLVAGLIFFLSFSVAERNTAELNRDKVELLLNQLASRIEAQLRPIEFLGTALEERLERAAMLDPGEPRDDQIMALLRNAMAGYPQLSGVAYFGLDGGYYGVQRNPSSETRAPDGETTPTIQSFLDDARSRAGGYWGEFVLPPQYSAPLLNYRVPVNAAEDYKGVLVLGVSIGELSLYLERLSDAQGAANFGTSFILLGRDRVVAHPLLQWTFPGLTQEDPLPKVQAFSDPLLSRLFLGRTEEPPERYRSDRFEVRWFQLADVYYIGFYRQLTGFTATPFTIGTVTLASDVDEQIRRLYTLLYLAGALIALTLLGGVLLGRGLARPIKRLREGAKKIEALEFERHPGFGRSRLRELDDAQRAFDAMVGGLKLFALYVPRGLVRRLIQAGLTQGPESEERRLTIMFTDIVGFTSLSETMPAREISTLLNHHFALLGEAVEAEGGTIDKYIGDALMAFWGAPEPQPDAELRAARAALAIAQALERDNALRLAAGEAPLRLRIGLHAGPVVVGNIGSAERVNYTIIGDAVNTGQRLESLGKEMAAQADREAECCILISGDVRALLGPDFVCEDKGEVQLRGRSGTVKVYRLLSGPES